MIIMSLDYSYANSGICVAEVDLSSPSQSHSESDKITILFSDVFLSDKKLDTIPRILGLIDKILEVYDEYKPDVIVREEAFVGKSSTAKGVLYAHAILELETYNRNIEIIDIHNATLKAYCRKYLTEKAFYTKEELKQFDKKQIVAEFLKAYFSSDMPEIYTARGRLEDDKADAICLSVFHFEKVVLKNNGKK